MMWKQMLERFRPRRTDEDLKAAALRETERLKAQLEQYGIQVELATHYTIETLERELRASATERQ